MKSVMTTQLRQTDLITGSSRPLTDSDFDIVRAWIYEAAGILLTPAKKALVQGRLTKRVVELGLGSLGEYIRYLTSSSANQAVVTERQYAINALTTNETYFFREPAHFDFIQQLAITVWSKTNKCRIWSAASSTGEEAYTVGMTLATAGFPDWEVVGTDINSDVVTHAAKGIYPLQRAEKIPQNQLKKFCLKGVGSMEGYFQLSPEVRNRVKFLQSNILKVQKSLGSFDVILLRNVLIYFDKASKQQVLDNIVSHLKPGGYLLLGHAESLNGLDHQLTNIKPSVYRIDN